LKEAVIQYWYGLEADRLSITPLLGEPIYTTDTKLMYIGDGVTPGGVRLPYARFLEYLGGQTYYPQETVWVDGYLCVANTETTDYPAPVPVGQEIYAYDGLSPAAPVTAKQVIYGQRYTLSGVTAQVLKYRIWAAIGGIYQVFSVHDPEGTPIINELLDATAQQAGWIEFNMVPVLIPDGTKFDLVVIATEPDPAPTTFSGNWDYQTPQITTVPASGQVIHSSREASEFRIHKTDNDATDRSATLESLTVGDIIDWGDGGIRWLIQATTDNGTWMNFQVAPATQETPSGIRNLTFETVVAVPITRILDPNYWGLNPPENATIQGLYGEDIPYDDIIPDTNAYGVDIFVQEVRQSEEWDLFGSPGGGTASGPGSGGISSIIYGLFKGPGSVGMVSDPVTADGKLLFDDGQWASSLRFAPSENGFVDRAESTISFDEGTRTFTITPVGSFTYFHNSMAYTKSAPENIVIPDLEGLHFIYYDGETLSQTQAFTPEIITLYAFVAAIYWDATNNEVIVLGEERHGNVMDSQTHVYNHNTLGARYDSGFALGNMDTDGNGNDATAAQLAVSDGILWDEDIEHVVTDGSPQELSLIAELPVYYLDGASAYWRKVAATQYPIATTGSGRAAYNEWTGAVWQVTEVGSNNFVLTHILATNNVPEPVIVIMGQAEYSTLNEAREGALVELKALSFGNLASLSPEFLPLATVIWETRNTYSNAVKSRIRSADGADYIDWRSARGGGVVGAAVSDHGTLTGLTDPEDHPQYLRREGNTALPTSSAGLSSGDLWNDSGTLKIV
jgi:hypothetical protein